MDRKDIGSWLQGPKAALEDQGVTFGYAGERLELPEVGPGSVASMGRRAVALTVDWFASMAIASFVSPSAQHAARDLLILEIFLGQVAILTALTGSSFGQKVLGIQVINISKKRLSVPRVAARTLLLGLVVPALIWDRDGRGLHDKAVESVAVRIR